MRGARWHVVEHTAFPDCEALRLGPAGHDARGRERTLLIPFDRPQRIERSSSIAVLRPRRWLHFVRRAEASAFPAGGLAAAAASRADLLPYQIEPALAMIRMGVTRVMIADAVGLGKTIQAALVLAELARREAFRGLVIVPAGLREQWCAELAQRFSLGTRNADAEWLVRTGRQLPSDVNPWALPGLYVSSFDFIKRPEVLQPLEGVTWDIVIVDEAHGASLGTARRAAVHAVAARATRVLLLTATPHAGDAEQFEALCRIGDPVGKGPPLLLFQRSRTDVGISGARRTIILPVRLSDPERRMHRLLDDYTSRVCREAEVRGDTRARLAAIVLKKRALSSAASLAASVRRRLFLIADGMSPPVEYQPGLPLEPDERESEGLPDTVPDEELEVPGLVDAARERRWLSVIAECAENASRHESKTRLLLRLLRRMRQPAIVFTEFRDTLERLHRAAASSGHDVFLLHGGLSPDERLSARRAFGARGGVLLATDAASEGLNLHEGCRVVIHYELPWSPGRLEQRTGRVDRIGQSQRVHEVLLVARDTAERLVLAPLARRATRARAASSFSARLAGVLSESRVAAAVMAGTRIEDTEGGVDSRILPTELVQVAPPSLREQGAVEAARLQYQRGVPSDPAPRRQSPVLVATVVRPRSSGLHPGIFCIYAIALTTENGEALDRQIVCVRSPWPIRIWPRASADVRRIVTDCLERTGPALREAALAAHADTRAGVATRHAEALDAMERRERTIASGLPSMARVMVQAGLFDRRAIRALRATQRVSGALLEASDERLRSLDRTRALVVAAELTAVLITCSGPG